jgi:hypothetical protein
MACPHFDPVRPREFSSGSHAMLPLGGHWAGFCRAESGVCWEPQGNVLDRLCNLGYARGTCPRFPIGDGPDAVRFTISRDAGDSLGLYFVLERNHLPFAHGPLAYSRAASRFVPPIADNLLSRQAQAYVDSYLRRKGEASPCA